MTTASLRSEPLLCVTGRVDERSYYLCKIPSDLPDASRWKNLAAIGISINNTERRRGDEIAVRYYIISKMLPGEDLAVAVRDDWGIENSCHWQLDVTFGEDQCRIRKGQRGGDHLRSMWQESVSISLQTGSFQRGGGHDRRDTRSARNLRRLVSDAG